jgi:ABC-type branched-subunit amino acid transport system substrate-binding protein
LKNFLQQSEYGFLTHLALLASLAAGIYAAPAQGQNSYDPGASDTEIKIGNIAPSSPSESEYGAVAHAEAAYFRMINDRGGVNGRKINFLSLQSSPEASNSLDLARRLVETDKVLLVFSTFGTESNLAIRGYLNQQKVPQLFVQSSSAVFNDPSHFPWTMGFFATYRTEGLVYAKYILQNKPGAKVAVLYANDDAGKEYLAGVHEGLGSNASQMIVKEVSYQTSDQTLEPQINALKDSGADVFLNLSVGTFATQAIATAYDLGWHPMQFIPNASLSVAASLEPAGLEKSTGIITNARSKSWTSPRAQSDPAVRDFLDWMRKYNPEASLRDQNNVAGYERAEALVEVLTRCGNDLTRASVMKQASSLNLELGMLRPGIRVTTRPTDYQPIKQLFLIRFDGREWMPFGATTVN